MVLALHGAAMNGSRMVTFTGLNETSESAGFIVVYPDGTGVGNLLTWNAGGIQDRWLHEKPDDVAFIGKLIDELATLANVDSRRIYCTGMSNGAMLTYRLAAELPGRIAAVAPVGGTMPLDADRPKQPLPVVHFHGTLDTLVPVERPPGKPARFVRFGTVDESLHAWIEVNGCPPDPVVVDLPDVKDDGTTVQCKTWGPGKSGSEVVLYLIEGGGHTWPGRAPPVAFLGKSTGDISANELMWQFFERHPLPPGTP